VSRVCFVPLVALMLGVLPGEPAAQQIAPEGSNFHNGSSLPQEDDGWARKRLARLAAALARADADEVAAELRGLRASAATALVPFGPRTHIPALDLAARMIVESGSQKVRERAEADTLELVRAARRTRDVEALIGLATRGSALQGSREAALAAARLSFERGAWWEAERLASRAGDLPDAAEIAAAARARAVSSPVREPLSAEWSWQGAAVVSQERAEDLFLPAVAEGLDAQLLLLDGRGLHTIDRNTGRVREAALDWRVDALGSEALDLALPAPRRHDLVHADQRLLIPFNPLMGPWRGLDRRRSSRLLGVEPGPALDVVFQTRLEPDRTISAALGRLTVSGTRVFAQQFRVGLRTEVSLVCFDARDGRLLWETPLVEGAQVRRFASRQAETNVWRLDKRAREGEVVERDGIVYACTGHGVVAAVDALTGRIVHTFRYDRVFSLDPGVYDPAFLYDTRAWDEEPARLFGDRLVVAPGDSRFLYTLALSPGARGHLILDDPIERLDRRYVVALLPDPGGSDSPAILATRRSSNRNGLVLIGPGGRTLAESPLLPEGEWFNGRPLAVAGRALVPSTSGLLDYDPTDLSAQPLRLTQDLQAAANVWAVFPVQGGLVTLSPLFGPTPTEADWYIQWYSSSP
jgi:hypothetical protein